MPYGNAGSTPDHHKPLVLQKNRNVHTLIADYTRCQKLGELEKDQTVGLLETDWSFEEIATGKKSKYRGGSLSG